MSHRSEKEKRFLAISNQYKDLIAKVCWLYAGSGSPFEDLYQEVLANLWQGMDTFRGDSKLSTWIYRAALNTCITWMRRNSRHFNQSLDNVPFEPADTSDDTAECREQYKILMSLIARLPAIDKALVSLWLDGKSYDEISLIIGFSASNVAVRLHRAKEKLKTMASSLNL